MDRTADFDYRHNPLAGIFFEESPVRGRPGSKSINFIYCRSRISQYKIAETTLLCDNSSSAHAVTQHKHDDEEWRPTLPGCNREEN